MFWRVLFGNLCAPFFLKPSTDYQANFIVEQSPANRKRDFRPTSANRILTALFATPSIEPKNQLGARKKKTKKKLKPRRRCALGRFPKGL
jgi:hypothetical protein